MRNAEDTRGLRSFSGTLGPCAPRTAFTLGEVEDPGTPAECLLDQ